MKKIVGQKIKIMSHSEDPKLLCPKLAHWKIVNLFRNPRKIPLWADFSKFADFGNPLKILIKFAQSRIIVIELLYLHYPKKSQ